ncbi:hypothetical protein [Lysobacter gummosus]|uniref:hypothetical protein n=1 Tax=Lysobacter gummosus TaxID=262324 RepID=UPI0036325648
MWARCVKLGSFLVGAGVGGSAGPGLQRRGLIGGPVQSQRIARRTGRGAPPRRKPRGLCGRALQARCLSIRPADHRSGKESIGPEGPSHKDLAAFAPGRQAPGPDGANPGPVAPNPGPGYTFAALRPVRPSSGPRPQPPTPGVIGEFTPAATARAGVPESSIARSSMQVRTRKRQGGPTPEPLVRCLRLG